MFIARQSLRALIDLALLSAAFWLAWVLRFDGEIPLMMLKRASFIWPYVVGFEFIVLSLFAVPRFAWRHVGLREAVRTFEALGTATIVLLAIRLAYEPLQRVWPYALYVAIPIGIIVLNLGLAGFAVVGIRVVRRMLAEREAVQLHRRLPRSNTPTLLVGAGSGGALVARELEKRPNLGIEPVGFVDDDSVKHGTLIQGIPVLGGTEKIAELALERGARQILVTISELSPDALRRIVKLCEATRLPVKLLPGISQVIEGQTGIGRLRSVSIEDLLQRDAVQLDEVLVASFVRGKRVLVTGAGGSIGSELCRQAAAHGPAKLVLIERCEFALFTIEQELRASFPDLTLVPRICDICDEQRLNSVFQADQPELIFHAAAHKHVPMMEHNPGEALKNNVFGTKGVAEAAARHGAQAFVMISTDKAVNPSSIMGATKRVAEMVVQSLSTKSATKFVAVRFGNVLGSAGSVIPIFKAQIAAGGPVTVTHPDMRRYFMTIPEASQLVLQAAAMGSGGEIFVLDMGTPVKILDLAHDLIRLTGLVPEVDIPVQFTGLRPGEKLFEELGFDEECMERTRHERIFVGKLGPISAEQLAAKLAKLRPYTDELRAPVVRDALQQAVPEMLDEDAPGCGASAEASLERVAVAGPSLDAAPAAV